MKRPHGDMNSRMKRTAARARRAVPGRGIPTSLGPSLRAAGHHRAIDLTALPLFHGLSVLSRALGERVVEHCLTERLDIDVEQRLRPADNPELAAMGCEGVKLLAERDVVAHVPRDRERFQHHLRAVLGTLQQERWRVRLLPPGDPARSTALVFTFPARGGFDYRFVLDRVSAGQGGRRFFLRIAVENPRGRRLDLASIRHVVVDDLGAREYIAGSTRIAQTLGDLVQREAARGRRAHIEARKEGSFLFGQLERGGLGHLGLLHLCWTERFRDRLLAIEPSRVEGLLKKALLLLEDRGVRRELGHGRTVAMQDGEERCYIDVSQQGTVLNLAFDQPRRRVTTDAYLQRMPALAEVVGRHEADRPLAACSVLLVHHTTAEVLGTVGALRRLGCPELDVLFVRYAGEIPHEYIEAIVDEPGVRSVALERVRDAGEVEGHFVPSRQFDAAATLDALAARLYATPARFYDAMVTAGVHLALHQLARARKARRRMLIVEDGGYVVPVLTRRAQAGDSVGAVADAFGVSGLPAELRRRPLASVLDETLLGSVEHTRNGFDRLADIEREAGRLARPAYSIAISRLKVEDEAREVASGVLAAIEAVYHATGKVLSARRPLVIGSRGAVGSALVAALSGARVQEAVVGLDRQAPGRRAREARRWQDLSVPIRRAVDLVVGATGVSVLGRAEAEEIVLHGTAPAVTFASASTKTVEFADVAEWIERLLATPTPRVGTHRVEIFPDEILDPQSGRIYGMGFTFRFAPSAKRADKRLVFLANLTPVNFLFYGVPTEVMDRVMAQLIRATLGLVRAVRRRPRLPARLYAVDRDVPDAELG